MFRIVILVHKNDVFGPKIFSPSPKISFSYKTNISDDLSNRSDER